MGLFGRDAERAVLAQRLAEGRRLVTVVGPGGVGKTALARAVLSDLAPSFPLGAHVVELSRVDRAEAVEGAIAMQLGFSSFEGLLQSPSDQPALVLVDNCEHVIDAAADAIAALLAACASPVVLATSRSPLGVAEESVVSLGPLDVPAVGDLADDSSAVRLFLDRVRHAGVDVAPAELEAAGELCRRLDGLPLAIELAAARTRTLTVTDILGRLAGGIDVLSGRGGRGRSRGLEETIEWSLGLLDAPMRTAFECLGVCAGPFTLDMAAAVAVPGSTGIDGALDVIERLVDASLVVAERGSRGIRYRVLEPVRAVAVARLTAAGHLDAARERFAAHVVEVVAELLEASRHRWDADLLPTVLELFDSIDAALRHFVRTDDSPDRALLLYATLWGAVHQARVEEIVELGRLVRGRWPGLESPFAADAAATLAMSLLLCGRRPEAVALAEEAAAHAHGGFYGPVTLQRVLALAARGEGDHERAARHLAVAVEAAIGSGVPTMAMECRIYQAQDVAWTGRPDEALATARAVAAEAQAAGSVINEIWARTAEGAVLLRSDLAAAGAVIDATLAWSEAIEYPFGVLCNLQSSTRRHLAAGSLSAAASTAAQLLEETTRAGPGDVRVALELAGAVLRATDRSLWLDLAATAATMPDTNPMVGPDRLDVTAATGGRVLGRAEAVRAARTALAVVAADPEAVAPVAAAPSPTAPASSAELPDEPTFVPLGDAWEVRFGGVDVIVRSSKGMADLAVLLAQPDRDVHCLELAGAGVDQSSTGEVIDATARRQYEARVRELQADIDEADASNDIGRAEQLRIELDLLVDHLTAALGLGGHRRRTASTADRARSAVTHRIRATIERLDAIHPALARHLRAAVVTGVYCSYRPAEPTVSRT